MSSDRPGFLGQTQAFPLDAGEQDGTTELAILPDLTFLRPAIQPGEIGRIGQYRVVRMLGMGGMGIVFEAEDLHLLRTVALKVMRPELAASLTNRNRFLKEARAAAAITSDYVVTVYQVGQDNDVPFLAMQLLHGESLEARLARDLRLDPVDALTIAIQAATGLSAAHEKGLIHRDIKPANLWLESNGDGGEFRRVRILDLGLVAGHGAGPKMTTAGAVVGTPHYMASEQAAGSGVDPRADLFSLGSVIYTMLSGELAFPGQSTIAVLMALATRTPPLLSTANPAVSEEFSALVARMMAKTPDERPGSANEVIEQLEALLTVELEKRPPSPLSRTRASGAVGWPLRRVSTSASVSASPADTLSGLRGPSVEITPPPVGGPDEPSESGVIPVAAGPSASTVRSRRRTRTLGTGVGLVALAVALIVFGLLAFGKRPGNPVAFVPAEVEPIRIGILHSQTGTMAVSEASVVDATLLAVEEVNKAGGVLGRPLKPIVVDGKSDPEEFARLADKLLTDDNVSVVFGCWTSASRKAVKPVIERSQGLLFYPVQYEGLEQSPHIVYTGPAPNQQLLPAIDFLTGKLGKKKLFLVGSDYVFPRTAHEIIKDRVKETKGVSIVGEAFIPLGSSNVTAAVRQIQAVKPDAIVNTINGSSNVHFFQELRAAGTTAETTPTLSVSIAESEVEGLNPMSLRGDFLAAAYFQSVDRPQNTEFVRKFREQFGAGRVVSDPMAAAYTGVHLWAQSATAAGSVEPLDVLPAVRGRHFEGPRARVTIDAVNQHAWLPVRIGRIEADGQVTILPEAGTEVPIHPVPFPPSRTRTQWEQFLRGLQFGWDGKWQPASRP